MDWYEGPSLLWTLENVQVASDRNLIDGRFPVQWVIRPQSDKYHDYRGYAGQVCGGIFRKGEEVTVLPSGFTSKIKAINTMNGELEEAFPPMGTTITLEDEIDISRGDMLAKPNNQPTVGQDIEMMICWLNINPLKMGGKYLVKHTTNEAKCIIKDVKYKVNVNTLEKNEEDKDIGANDIGRITIKTAKPLLYDSYRKNRYTGSVIIIDQFSHETVGAGMII
jgi:sulfate adenylyltransferase subunit 1